ncbi:MAG TPA: hypothetical protein VJ841_04710 [Candidatus Saccharimonadales bacterium]|nr:hypothetical protein [Candidatus Saccharimonadales bacterium]
MNQPEMHASTEGTLSLQYPSIPLARHRSHDEQIESITVGEAAALLLGIADPPISLSMKDMSTTLSYAFQIGMQKVPTPSTARVFLSESIDTMSLKGTGLQASQISSIACKRDRTADLRKLEQALIESIEKRESIAMIALSGGTPYDQAIDEIAEAVKLRDRLVEEYSLNYRPHIHVDSHVGWPWLTFETYDWQSGNLRLPGAVQRNLRRQYLRIRPVTEADSWVVDISALTGHLEQPVIMLNNTVTDIPTTEQADASFIVEMGQSGYQKHLAQFTDSIHYVRFLLKRHLDIHIANVRSDGYIAAIRLTPPGMTHHAIPNEVPSRALPTQRQIQRINEYTSAFFEWAQRSERVPYLDFTDHYAQSASGTIINALLIEADSSFTREVARQTVEQLTEAKQQFNRTIWSELTR